MCTENRLLIAIDLPVFPFNIIKSIYSELSIMMKVSYLLAPRKSHTRKTLFTKKKITVVVDFII
jgi:hypothetical protein